MLKHSLIICALALAGCAVNPAGSTARAYASNGDRPISPPAHCDRIKVVCADLSAPGAALRTLPLPTMTLPVVPSLLTLPR